MCDQGRVVMNRTQGTSKKRKTFKTPPKNPFCPVAGTRIPRSYLSGKVRGTWFGAVMVVISLGVLLL